MPKLYQGLNACVSEILSSRPMRDYTKEKSLPPTAEGHRVYFNRALISAAIRPGVLLKSPNSQTRRYRPNVIADFVL